MDPADQPRSWLERAATSSWFLLRTLGEVLQRLVAEWQGLPLTLRRRWLRTLFLSWLATAIVMAILGAAGKSLAVAGELAFESALLERLAAALPLAFDAAIWMGAPANPVFLTTLVLGLAVVAAWQRYPLASLTILASFFMVDMVIVLGWMTWNRPRPELVYGGAAVPGLQSFPSGHVTQATAVYGVLLFLWWHFSGSRVEQVVVLVATTALLLLLAATRLRLGVHWPSDVIAGFIVGPLWAGLLVRALRQAWAELAQREQSVEGG